MVPMQRASAPSPASDHAVDESRELELGAADVVLGLLTAPLLLWVLMYAVTGHERLYATPSARRRVYLVLLVLEALVGVGLLAWVAR